MYKEYVIKGIEKVGSSKIFKLFPEKEGIEFKAGQFVKIMDNEEKEGRPYSIASPPEFNYLEFLIKISGGKFTGYLDTLKEGDKLKVSKAAGHLTLRENNKRIFIAGGTGIAPLISLIRSISINKLGGENYLFYSTRTLKDMAYYSELNLLDKMGIIKFIPVITRESIEGAENRHIDKEMIEKYVKGVEEFTFYMCGRNALVFSVRDFLLEKGIDRKNLVIEAWG